jgi:diguanylate cyclase (GGDEF)-like protein
MSVVASHPHSLLFSASPAIRALLAKQVASDFLSESPSAELREEPGGLWRLLGATMALLNHTHAELEKAQKDVRHLEKRLSELEAIATVDDLTGLKNRRGFYEAFACELDRSGRSLSKGGILVIIDLDNFKAINDTFSHQAGDSCLRLVGKTLAGEIRHMDTAARLGGDEFVLLLSDTAKEDALSRIQNLSRNLNNLSLIWNGHEIPIRASVGLRAYSKGDQPDDIFGEADAALYRDKSRNKHEQERVASL